MQTKVFKVVIVGDSGVGKTAFVKNFVFGAAANSAGSSGTIGVDFAVKTLEWKNGDVVKLQVWDIGGQDRSAFLARTFCHRAHGIVVLFDVTDPQSFENVSRWKSEVDERCRRDKRSPFPCILLANKCDLNTRKVKMMDIDQATKDMGFITWREISVKEGFNIWESVMTLIDAMLSHDYRVIGVNGHANGIVRLADGRKVKHRNKCMLH